MFKHLLVPLDGSTLAECVLPHAVALARAFDAKVTLMRVLECPPDEMSPADPLAWELLKAEAAAYLEVRAEDLQEAGLSVEVVLPEGSAAHVTVDFAHHHDVDLILLSSHGEGGISGWNIGSVIRKILQRSCRSLLIVRAYEFTANGLTGRRYARVLVPMDGSQRAECALPAALRLAQAQGAELLLAHAVSRPEMPRTGPPTQEDVELADRLVERNRQVAARYLEGLQERLHDHVQTRLLVAEDVAVSLHALAEEEGIDLVIVSAHGYSAKTKWPYGSVTSSFIEYGNAPLLIVQDLTPAEVEETRAEEAAHEHGRAPAHADRWVGDAQR